MSRCQCGACLVARLQGIGSLLGRGRTAMAATALESVTAELAAYVSKAKAAAPIRHPPRPAGSGMATQRAQRLALLLAGCPALRAVAATALKVRPADVDVIATGRVLLTAQRWQRLFDALASES